MGTTEVKEKPVMQSIPKTAQLTGISQFALRKLASKGEIPSFSSGKKVYINVHALMEILGGKERVAKLSIE